MGYPPPGTGVPPTASTGVPPGLQYPPVRDWGPVTGVPLGKDMGPVEVLWGGDGVLPRKNMEPVEELWDGEGSPPSGGGQTENITSRRTSLAGGNKRFFTVNTR